MATPFSTTIANPIDPSERQVCVSHRAGGLALKLGHLVQELLQDIVVDLVGDGRDERLGFFRAVAAKRAYTRERKKRISKTGAPRPQQSARSWRIPICARSNLFSCLWELSRRSTASTFSFCLKRAKASR